MQAWQKANKLANTRLVVIHNYDGDKPSIEQTNNIKKYSPDHYWPRKNKGQDIGALRDLLQNHAYDPWDVLLWMVDDNIPIHKDFILKFTKPFEDDPKLGLIGNYWVKSSFYGHYSTTMRDHVRTSCFAIRREVAKSLYFPSKLRHKWDCYAFEWMGLEMCLTEQVMRMGYGVQQVDGDFETPWTKTSRYVWDTGAINLQSKDPRCYNDYWKEWNAQFN